MSNLNHSCLLLSYDYTALRVIPVKQAFKLVFSDKAEIVTEFKDKVVRTVSRAFKLASRRKAAKQIQIEVQRAPHTKEHFDTR